MMERKSLSVKKAQIYTLDFLLAVFMITLGVVLSMKLIVNSASSDDFALLLIEGRAISDALLSSGAPSDWNTTNVILPGMTTNNRLDLNKMAQIRELGYNNVSSLLNSRKNYYFYFKNSTGIQNLTFCGFGALPDSCVEPVIQSTNLVKLERITLLNTTPIKMVMLVWE